MIDLRVLYHIFSVFVKKCIFCLKVYRLAFVNMAETAEPIPSSKTAGRWKKVPFLSLKMDENIPGNYSGVFVEMLNKA
ncbi:MAG: hypothetical protein ACLVHV_15675 [Oscillospiraceae bacterium]